MSKSLLYELVWLQRCGKISVVCVSKLKPKVYRYLDGTVRSAIYMLLRALYCKDSRLIRFADNRMIHGTKLLKVVGMTRGGRDRLLRLEKTRHVIKTSPSHFRGV